MRPDILELDASLSRALRDQPISLHDAEAIRLLITGGSVVDWQRLHMRDRAEVDNFLRLHGLNMAEAAGHERLRFVFNEAVSYLEEHMKIQFPADLRTPNDVRDVFLWASAEGNFRRTQILSCVILKLMHVIQHLEAADLRFRASISEVELLEVAHRHILGAARRMGADGVPLVAFYGNRKSRSSVITKLIAKKENVAATIFDKLRYRIVVETAADLVPALGWLSRELFPFNYVIPGQSQNNLLPLSELPSHVPASQREAAELLFAEDAARLAGITNEFSGSTYRMINFIVDFPVPIHSVPAGHFAFELGQVAYVLVEFQVVDQHTAEANEKGENAHHNYKSRQHQQVARRLKRGRFLRHGLPQT